MADTKKFVLVTGATGQQGGSVVQALLKRGHRVRGLTRNTDSAKAKALASQGVEVVAGDFTHADSLAKAVAGVDAIYAMTTPFESGMDAETAQGIAVMNVAKEAGVGHFIYSSVGGASEKTGIPHFDSKHEVEKALMASGLSYSISGPVYFMDNLLGPWSLPDLLKGKISAPMPGDRKLQQVAVADIGAFAAALIERGERVFGHRYDIAGDELTNDEMAAVISEAMGSEVSYEGFPVEGMKAQNEDMGLMYEWFDTTGYSADIGALRRDFPEVGWHDYKSWASKVDWNALRSA